MNHQSIFKYYKANDENLEAIEKPFLFFASAKTWESAGEFNFNIDLKTPEVYRAFVIDNIRLQYELDKNSQEYKIFRQCTYTTLKENNKLIHFDIATELDILADILTHQAFTRDGLNSRTISIKNLFFNKSGVSCCTGNADTLTKADHWKIFALSGTGFCVEYSWPALSKYFFENQRYVHGGFVKYYEADQLPILDPTEQNKFEENLVDIIFSLKQSLKDETEFRLSKVYRQEMAADSLERIETIPPAAILSITCGWDIEIENEKKILKIAGDLDTKIIVNKILKIGDEYSIQKIST